MNRPKKRKLPQIDYEEIAYCDSSDDYDSSDYDSSDDSDTSSDEEAEDNDIDPVDTKVGEFVWGDVPSTFSPQKIVPEHKEVEYKEIDENDSITDVFLKLFPESLFIWIAECTNERLKILSEEKQKKIKPTDANEIKIVIGCLLVMSYNRVPHLYMYWSNNKSVRNETIVSAISRDRFMLLHSKLYFNHPKKSNDATKTYYMDEFVNCLTYTFNRFRTESTYQSIDEFMVKFKGRTSMKQFMPFKPVKRGMKGYCRSDADSGYVYDFFLYKGKKNETGEQVVTTLCSTIRENNVAIIIDRFFTSVNLIQTLDFACVGTVMSTRKNLPDMTGKVPRGQSIAKCTNGGIICYKWQDTKEVMLLSNCHENKIGIANRKLSCGILKEFDCPEAIIFYNRYMAGVDKSDQYSTYYEIDRKSNKWWKRVFYRLLLIAVTNSWIIHKKFRAKYMSLIDFLMPLSEQIIEIGKRGAKKIRKIKTKAPSKRLKQVENIGHQPLRQNTRESCTLCESKKIQSRTCYICSTCKVPLCADCFAPYHGHKN